MAATFGLVLAGLALMAGSSAASLLMYGQLHIRQHDVDSRAEVGSGTETTGEAGEPEPEELEGILNVLAVGSDSRAGLTRDDLRRIGTEDDNSSRTDSIMLVQLDLSENDASVLSLPRDLLVTRCDGSRGRINAAYGIGERAGVGGGTCLVETVTQLTGIPIHHYVQVDFAGFIDVVDTLGGVSLYLDEPLQDEKAGVDLAAGCVEMDGATALGYVRSRHADGQGDLGRVGRQQRFVRAVADEAASLSTIINLPQMFQLVRSVAESLETDEDLSVGDMRRIAWSMRDLDPEALDVYTVPGTPRVLSSGAWVLDVDQAEAERLYTAFRQGSPVPEGVGDTEVDLDDVPPLRVHDATGDEWTLQQALDLLAAAELEVAEVDEATADDLGIEPVTEIHYPDRLQDEAAVLASHLDDARLRPGDDEESLTLVLGTDALERLESLQAPPSEEPVPTPTPAPSPTADGQPEPSDADGPDDPEREAC